MGHSHSNHTHTHTHSHAHSHDTPPSLNTAFATAVILNFGFTVFQTIYALLANSMGLLADAMHNFGDVFGLLLAWGANWLLTLPARKRYSYGFKRTTIIAALINALMLTAMAALIAFQSINKLFDPSEMNEKIVIIVAVIGIFINTGTALLFMKNSDDLNIKGAFLHLLGDAVVSIGVVISAVLILYTHLMWIDAVTGLLIVLIIMWGTWGLLRDSVRLILDAVPRHIDQHGVEEFLKQLPGVVSVHDLHIWGLSTKEIALTAHLIMPESVLHDEDYEKINAVLKKEFHIEHVTLQVETGNMNFRCQQSDAC